jgi:hypothetical protein
VVLGLRWDHVDQRLATVKVRIQRTFAGGSAVTGAPNTTAGNRTVAFDTSTIDGLKAWPKRQAAERQALVGSPRGGQVGADHLSRAGRRNAVSVVRCRDRRGLLLGSSVR